MTVYTIKASQWASSLKATTERDTQLLIKAARETAFVDAPRWIQWSIHGGNKDSAPADPTSTPPAPEKPATPAKRADKNKGQRAKVKQARKKSGKKATVKKGKKAKVKSAATSVPSYRVPVDTGEYANSWTPANIANGAEIYSASNPRMKAGVIELGRRPGKGIPIEPLAAWVRRKMNVRDLDAAKAIARKISWKAKKHGRKGLHVLGRAHPKISDAFHANAVKMLKRGRP